jgi:hypothetical protein
MDFTVLQCSSDVVSIIWYSGKEIHSNYVFGGIFYIMQTFKEKNHQYSGNRIQYKPTTLKNALRFRQETSSYTQRNAWQYFWWRWNRVYLEEISYQSSDVFINDSEDLFHDYLKHLMKQLSWESWVRLSAGGILSLARVSQIVIRGAFLTPKKSAV